jgi:hypothetical protein
VTIMKTAVLDSGFASSTQQTIPLVLEPARRTHRAVLSSIALAKEQAREKRVGESGKARKPKRVVVPFSVPEMGLEAPNARIQVPKPGVWGWAEFGFVTVLLASAFVLISLSMAAAGNL